MKAVINNIRSQPHHVRHLATVVCTVAVVAVVAVVWFNAFQHDVYALLNPSETQTAGEPQDKLFATQSKSLLGSIFQIFGDTKAQLSSFVSGKGNKTDIVNTQATTQTDTAVHPFAFLGAVVGDWTFLSITHCR